jgi:hypothetical protein
VDPEYDLAMAWEQQDSAVEDARYGAVVDGSAPGGDRVEVIVPEDGRVPAAVGGVGPERKQDNAKHDVKSNCQQRQPDQVKSAARTLTGLATQRNHRYRQAEEDRDEVVQRGLHGGPRNGSERWPEFPSGLAVVR